MRDKNLDIYRGWIMIYIIGVIHVMYWAKMVNGELKSYFLFEMAVIFFITGASHTLSKPKPLIHYYIKRIERFLIPFWFFTFVCIFFIMLLMSYGVHTNQSRSPKYIILNWINPFGTHPTNLPYITWHLWFIPIYLIIMFLIPLIYKLYTKLPSKFNWFPLIIFGIGVLLGEHYLPSNSYSYYTKLTVFYTFWTYLGFYYPKFKNKPLKFYQSIFISVLSFAIVLYLIKNGYYRSDMQFNKFPPNMLFLFFTISWFFILVSFRKIFVKVGNLKFISNLVSSYASYGYTYYLYQPFSFLAANIVLFNILKLNTTLDQKWQLGILYSLFIIMFTLFYKLVFYKFETLNVLSNRIKTDGESLKK